MGRSNISAARELSSVSKHKLVADDETQTILFGSKHRIAGYLKLREQLSSESNWHAFDHGLSDLRGSLFGHSTDGVVNDVESPSDIAREQSPAVLSPSFVNICVGTLCRRRLDESCDLSRKKRLR